MAAEAPGTARDRKVRIRPLIAIGVIAAACGIALGLIINWFPVAASAEAEDVDRLWDILLIASIPIFALVQTIVLYCVWKFRMRPGEENMDGPPIHGNTRLEIVWTTIPALLLVGLCATSYIVLHNIESAAAGPKLNVRVVGEQFTWTFFYPGEGGKEISSHELYLPIDTQVEFTVQSKDVIHDFWVPAFREKIDAVPGINTHYGVETTRTGDYPVVCAELCGLGHSTMRQTAHVLPKPDFDKWLADTRAKAAQAQ
jgi:cytochrome c oxidase subunit 2